MPCMPPCLQIPGAASPAAFVSRVHCLVRVASLARKRRCASVRSVMVLACLLALVGTIAPIAPARAGMDDLLHGGFLHEQESRFLPGAYYFTKGNEYLHRGDTAEAIRLWQISAGWAMKEAQYNLGIAFFKGEGVPQDRPLGLAWLALAAERKDPAFEESLAAAWDEATSSA